LKSVINFFLKTLFQLLSYLLEQLVFHLLNTLKSQSFFRRRRLNCLLFGFLWNLRAYSLALSNTWFLFYRFWHLFLAIFLSIVMSSLILFLKSSFALFIRQLRFVTALFFFLFCFYSVGIELKWLWSRVWNI
jgi:hypothetical protein